MTEWVWAVISDGQKHRQSRNLPSLMVRLHLYLTSAPLGAAAVTHMSHPPNPCIPGQQKCSVPDGLEAVLSQWGRWGYQVVDNRSGAYWKEIELLRLGQS